MGLPVTPIEVGPPDRDRERVPGCTREAGIDKKVVPYTAWHTYGTNTMEKRGNAFAVAKSMGYKLFMWLRKCI